MNTPKHIRDNAIILRTQNLSEADRIIIMLTQHHGIIHAVAKAIRKPNSKFGARLEPYMHTDLAFTRGKSNLHTITQASTLHAYTAAIMGKYETYTAANTLTELAEILNTNSATEDTTDQYHLLHGALATLAHDQHVPQRVLTSYILRAMKLAGWPLFIHNQLEALTPEERIYVHALYEGTWTVIDNAPHHITRKILSFVLATTQNYLELPLKTLKYLELEP